MKPRPPISKNFCSVRNICSRRLPIFVRIGQWNESEGDAPLVKFKFKSEFECASMCSHSKAAWMSNIKCRKYFADCVVLWRRALRTILKTAVRRIKHTAAVLVHNRGLNGTLVAVALLAASSHQYFYTVDLVFYIPRGRMYKKWNEPTNKFTRSFVRRMTVFSHSFLSPSAEIRLALE